jgi:hypothetical protein
VRVSLLVPRIIIVNLILMSFVSSVDAAENIFSKILSSSNENDVNQCVKAINNTADDELDTATRTYQIGMCHFCVGCNYELDNGQLFLVDNFNSDEIDELTSDEKYKIAYRLFKQATTLGHRKANYALAVMLYVKDLGKRRQFEVNIMTSNEVLLSKVSNHTSEMINNSSDAVDVLMKDAFERSNDNSFNHKIHKHLLKAAKEGYLPAQFALSEVYFKGVGIEPDAIQAYAWASVAVAQNPPFGSLRRDEKATHFDHIKMNKAHALAEEYIRKYSTIF